MSSVVTGLVNIALVLLLAPFFEGVMRKLKAVIHSRQGPPITQPYYDLLKLLGKEDLRVTPGALYYMAPMLAFGSLLVVAVITPFGGGKNPLNGDVVMWLYFLGFSAVAMMLAAFSSQNPYAYVGAGRKMMMLLTAEPVIVVSLVAAGVKAGSLQLPDIISWQLNHGVTISMVIAAVAFFLALQANIGKLPFDIAEAETEIMEGPFIEQSGPRLALFKMTMYGKQMIFASVFAQVFVPWPKGLQMFPLGIVSNLAKVLVVMLLVGVIDSVNPRLRIDQSMNFFARVVFISLAALAFAAAGV
jgi:formate hydrogenlyase subunit 4